MNAHITQHVQFMMDPTLAPLMAVLGYQNILTATMPAPGQGYGDPNQQEPSSPKAANLPKNPATG